MTEPHTSGAVTVLAPEGRSASAARRVIEQALTELRHLGEPARDGDPRHRMTAKIFQHAAGSDNSYFG